MSDYYAPGNEAWRAQIAAYNNSDEQQRKANGSAEVISMETGARVNEPDPTHAFTFLGDAPAAPPRELIKKLLPANGVVIQGGQSSAGKTFLEIHKSVCLAAELPFFGQRIIERVGTVFVAAEGKALIPNRFAAALANASITKTLPIAWINQLPNLTSLEGFKLFVDQLKAVDERFRGEFGVRLGQFVVDTVAATFAMKSEDDNAEATAICNLLRRAGEETESLAVAVHHYGKNPESGLRMAFKRALDKLPLSEFSAGEAEGTEWIWRIS